MGNFSRNTFDPSKNYVGVRLQQGVPLVDADWNEQNDVTRHEVYDSLSAFLPDGVFESGHLRVDDDTEGILLLNPGTAILRGRLVKVPEKILYTKQRWTDPARAARDGVAVIPPLTGASQRRTDIAYVDAWDREVDSAEDPNIVNPVIGIETSVRLIREVALRVAEGASTLPEPPPGHYFLRCARLEREAGSAPNSFSNFEGPKLITGIPGISILSFVPAFHPWNTSPPQPVSAWQLVWSPAGKPWAEVGPGTCVGFLELRLPHGARVATIQITGTTAAGVGVTFTLRRYVHYVGGAVEDLATTTSAGSPFFASMQIPDATNGVDNGSYGYLLYAKADGGANAQIHGVIAGCVVGSIG